VALLSRTPARAPATGGVVTTDIADRLVVETNPRARRLGLRVEPARDCVVLVRPKRVSDKAVNAFIAEHLSWIRDHLNRLPARVPFADGSIIPFRGSDHVIAVRPEARGGVWREGGKIVVAGRPEHTSRRVTDWLRKEARSQLVPLVHELAAKANRRAVRITVRDTRTRWGSCAQSGSLSFSWRLILAPDFVLTYVAAHEVAHLVHANHGRAFKDAVRKLLEPYGVTVESASEWLSRRGTALHGYG
jgi:predicted metal-dependent hydrolase